MATEWTSEKSWKTALNRARGEVRRLEAGGFSVNARRIAESRQRAERIRAAGLPEWQQRDDPRHLPLP